MTRSAAPLLPLLLLACSPRPEPPAPVPVNPALRQVADSTPARAQAPRADTTARVRPYREVITSRARSDSGAITVHWVGERLYFELPDSLLGRTS